MASHLQVWGVGGGPGQPGGVAGVLLAEVKVLLLEGAPPGRLLPSPDLSKIRGD